MKLREKFERRHVHTWVKSFEHSDFGFEFELERECTDCGKTQHVRIDREQKSSLPESVLHLGDFGWKDGAL